VFTVTVTWVGGELAAGAGTGLLGAGAGAAAGAGAGAGVTGVTEEGPLEAAVAVEPGPAARWLFSGVPEPEDEF
jgi:hypothetical protein